MYLVSPSYNSSICYYVCNALSLVSPGSFSPHNESVCLLSASHLSTPSTNSGHYHLLQLLSGPLHINLSFPVSLFPCVFLSSIGLWDPLKEISSYQSMCVYLC